MGRYDVRCLPPAGLRASPAETTVNITASVTSPTVIMRLISTASIKENEKPENLMISAYPNPFNGSCRIIAPDNTLSKIYDLTGSIVAEGTGSFMFTPSFSMPGGLYLVKTDSDEKTLRLIYVK
jgi:hypothetical protein